MIEERRCSYEVCKLLHEKGFDVKCTDWYRENNINIWKPTHQMACDWLMTKGIYICPKYCCFQGSKKNDKPFYKWEPTILSLTSTFPIYPQPLDMCEHFDTFGEAVDFCIKYSLENLGKFGKVMKIKFGNRWYDVLDIKESCGITWYAIEDEPNHIDWINNPEDIKE